MIEIPWKKIDEAEYGQKVGRRVKTAIFLTPIALFSKARKHYLTITYKDAKGEGQSAVFELGKELVRTTLAVMEARTRPEDHLPGRGSGQAAGELAP